MALRNESLHNESTGIPTSFLPNILIFDGNYIKLKQVFDENPWLREEQNLYLATDVSRPDNDSHLSEKALDQLGEFDGLFEGIFINLLTGGNEVVQVLPDGGFEKFLTEFPSQKPGIGLWETIALVYRFAFSQAGFSWTEDMMFHVLIVGDESDRQFAQAIDESEDCVDAYYLHWKQFGEWCACMQRECLEFQESTGDPYIVA